MNITYILSAGLEFFFALISIILLIGCFLDHDRNRKTNQIMITILFINSIMNIADACIWIWCDVPNLLILMQVLSFLSYALGCALIALFAYLLVTSIREFTIVPQWIDRMIFGISLLMAVLWIISIFNGMYYYWDENGVCQLGDFFWLSQLFGILFFVFDIALVIYYHKALEKKDSSVLILYSAIPLVSYAFVYYWDVTPLYMATTIVLLIYYIIIHAEHGQRIAEQETRLIKQELELTNSQTAIILTQVRPHFLYNSLTAIAMLCEKDPRKAKETTLNFSEYLRQNMDSLNQKNLISFMEELEHIKTYLAIEQVRFGEFLKVKYDINDTDFIMPPLTLQPIVENAVKHGVGMKEDGGLISISTKKDDDFHIITISDNGVGFNIKDLDEDTDKHIGIRLVRVRLEKLVKGSLTIKSTIDVGTTMIIKIPIDK